MGIEVRGAEETVEMLDGIAERCGDTTPAMRQVADHILGVSRQCFASRSAPDGTPWAPLKPHTQKYRKPDGSLEKSVYATAAKDSVKYGASADYAAYQNATRPFLPDDLDEESLALITQFLMGG